MQQNRGPHWDSRNVRSRFDVHFQWKTGSLSEIITGICFMNSEEITSLSLNLKVPEKRDLKGKLYSIKDLLFEKAFDLEGF